ncbi:uracil-DNA glycosylase [Bordetella parapertussis]|uniref:Type-4 uracil-DNA glycosylase n=1 Tax=Bordetella parapertussis (strain Bpp5) TaxID=1208660 RepID=K0MIN2_BORPB|nr:uracil-DNA glycosylase [Bordetella parapertussis]CCJ50654.1 bacteriophage-related DNA polymerase [Bordetella parapertussis Bpp5]
MSAPEAAVPAAPRPNPLQRIWLREIGIEKTWLPAPLASAAGAAAPAAPVAEADGQAARAAVAARAAGADLGQLQQLVQDCTACGLCQGRRHAVFGMGAQPARWMVVGEAPGEQEDRQGLPFVGRSGKLLDAMLQSVGMSRERDVFIANVIKCRPPGNRNPKPEEIAACSPYLRRQIALLNPERILVLGRFAAQTLLGTEATIGNLRGRVHSLQTDEGRSIPVVVSYHPAYLLRSPAEKARAWQDLLLAARG